MTSSNGPYMAQVANLTAQIIGRNNIKDYRNVTKQADISVGESVKIIRQLQEPSQIELAELTNILQSTISAIENERVNLGVERARALASALNCHPAVLVFPGWRLAHKSAA